MRAFARGALFVAGLQLQAAVLTSPSLARAQGGPQPVPYPTAPQPVPYGQAAPAPAPPPPPLPARPDAAAAQAGQDVIVMKNGGMLRGTIIDAIPDAQARIQLATGEIATVPWQAIARIDHAGEAPRPRRPGPGLAATVWVHVEGAEDAEVQQKKGPDGEWTTVCSGACDVQLPLGADYRIAGGSIRASSVFHLTGSPGDRVTINVTGASKAWFVLGIVAVSLGGAVTLIGLLVGFVGSVGASVSTGVDNQNWNSLARAGWITFGVGAVALVGGILMITGNAKTSAMQDVGPPAQTGLLVQSDAWKRVPTWRDATPEERALPPAMELPLWTGRF